MKLSLSHWILGQVWCLIKSIPDLCPFSYFEWLEKVSLTETIESDTSLTWSAHYASINRGLAFEVSIAALLPFIREQAYSVATVRHVMDKIKEHWHTLTHIRFLSSLLINLSIQYIKRYNSSGQSNTTKTSL